MAVDLFGAPASASSSAPKGVDLFAGGNSTVDLFSDAQNATSTTPGFLDHLGNAIGGSLGGGVTPEMVPAEPYARLGLGIISAGQDIEKLYREDPLNPKVSQFDQESRKRLEQVNRDRELTQGILKDIGAQDPSKFAGLVGSAIESLGPSAAGLVAMGLGAPVGGAMAVGLSANLLTETANEFGERRDLKQAADDAVMGALRHGVVSTALETLPLAAGLKYVSGASKELGKTLLKVGGGEAIQEGLTQVHKDIATNLEGVTDYTAEAILSRTLDAAATGAIMVPLMAPAAGAIRRGRMYGEAKRELAQEKALLDTVHQTLTDNGVFPAGGTTDSLAQTGTIIESIRAQKANPVLAHLQAGQMNGEYADLPAEPVGTAVGEALTRAFPESRRTGASLAAAFEDVGGVTDAVQRRREEYVLAGFAGNDTPLTKRVVYYQTNPNAVGLRMEQIQDFPDGSITVLGGNLMSVNALAPGMMAELVGEAITAFQKISGIQMPIIVPMEQLDGGQTGGYTTIPLDNGRYAHVINPRELPSAKFEHGGNRTTQLEFLGTLSHEFGHALKREAFQQGIVRAAARANLSMEDTLNLTKSLDDAIRGFVVTPEQIDSLRQIAPVEAELVAHWQDVQSRARAGTISGKELIKAWYGPRKLGLSFENKQSTQSIFAWVEREARNLGIRHSVDNMTANEVMAAVKARTQRDANGVVTYETDAQGNVQADTDYFLAFDEFMAEQFSRAAHDRGYLKGTRLGQWFQGAIANLRAFFGGLKDQGFVKPHETFEAWLDQQTALAAKLKRPKKWGQVTLTKEMQKRQKAQAKALMEEREALREAGELELATLDEKDPIPLPDDEVAATPMTRDEKMSTLIGELVDEGLIEENDAQWRKLVDMAAKQQYDELEERIWDIRGGSWDQGNVTTKLISRLPEKEMLKRVTVEGFAKQLDLKKQDVLALERVLAAYPDGNIPRAAIISAVLDRNVPLTETANADYADYGLIDAGILGDWTTDKREAVTHIWQAPFAVGKDNHFSDPQYVAHTRVVDDGSVRLVVELQSDYFQKQSKKDLELKVKNARTYAITREADVARLNNELILAHSIQEQQKKAAALTTAQLRLKEAEISYQRYERQLAGLPISEEHEKLNASMQRDDWWKRIIKEEIASAAQSGKSELRLVDADTLARIEGWPMTGTIPTDVLQKFNEARTTIYAKMGAEPRYVELFTGRFSRNGATSFRQWNFLMDSEVYGERWLRVSDMNDEMVEAMDAASKPLYSIAPDYGDMQGIYERYQKIIPKYLQKEFGAVHITTKDMRREIAPGERITSVNEHLLDRYENGFWSFSIPEAAKTVMLWDQGNPASPTYPQITADYLAGLTLEEMRSPEMVAQAVEMWRTQGFDSPFFKRWNGRNQLKEANGKEPLLVFHGSGQVIEFFDINLATQERAFFFTDNPLNANFYGKQIWRPTTFFKNPEDSRKAQTLRSKIAKLGEMLDTYAKGRPIYSASGVSIAPDMRKVRGEFMRLKGELTKLQDEADTLPTKAVTTGFYIRMENPLEIDFQNQEWVHGAYDEIIRQARELGHDGIVVRNVYDPSLATVYLVFNSEQIKDAYRQKGPFEESDRVQWDQGNPQAQALKDLAGKLKKISPDTALNGAMNLWHRTMDALVQLQQRAAVPLPNGTLDIPMQKMQLDLMKGQALKNALQQPGELLTKALQKRSIAEQDQIYAFLEAEWKSGKSLFALQGWTGNLDDLTREQVWGDLPDGGRDVSAATGKMVNFWEYAPKPEAAAELAKHGIDISTDRGLELLQLITQYKTTIMEQMTMLERVLQKKIVHRFQTNTVMAATQVEQLYQTMQKIRLSPFFPQGRYGDYSITIQQKKDNPKKGERKFKTVRVEYFETKAEMQTALERWQPQIRKNAGMLKMSWKQAQDYRGIPLTLPRNLLEQLEATQLFTKDQLETMSEMMMPVGHEKLAVKLGKVNDTTAGGERDLIRNYSNFIWHNANFIWKLDFRSEFTKAINAQNALLRRAQAIPTAQGLAQADALQRNTDIMNRVKEYVLYPPYELQSLRTAATLVFLAYNAKTALMNIGTMLNTYAAITTEYGEIQGHKLFAKALYDTTRLYGMAKNPKTAHIKSDAIVAEDSVLAWMYNKAVSEGIIDQSYAYFLAGQANGAAMMRGIRRGPLGKMTQVAAEVGMYPFRMVEKMNRLSTLVMFFEAERGRGVDVETAYAAAVKRTNLLQNAYDSGNRSELFRGKKAILTMFASYTQFMSWNMLGGYSKALKADLRARDLGEAKHMLGENAYTMKLWVIYMMLGGMLAGPFAENLMEVLAFIYRKVYGGNLRLEVRKFIKDLGGNADLVMHGVLGNAAGMDLSGSFSIGRTLPGVDMLNRDYKNYQEWLGSLGVKGAGAFGGFTEDLVKFVHASWEYAQGNARGVEPLKELPGAAGAVGKAYDAWVLQKLQPTYGVMDKAGRRIVEDPPGSQNFRDLTNWELIGMALGGNPSALSRSREMNFTEVGEQIYWRTKIQSYLDARWKAVSTADGDMLKSVDAKIEQFNETLPKGYEQLRITGKVKADSLKSHRKTVNKGEAGIVPRRLRGVQSQVETGFAQ